MNAIEFINQTKVEVDENAVPESDEVTIEQKRSRRTLISMRLALVLLTLAALALLGWILWMVYDLVV